MNSRLTVITVLAALLISGCTSESPTETSASPTASTSSSASAPGTASTKNEVTLAAADLTKLQITRVTGKTPANLPTWKPGGNAEIFSVETLNYLSWAARKNGMTVPPLSYLVYNGDSRKTIGCTGSTLLPSGQAYAAGESRAVFYCPRIGTHKSVIVLNLKSDVWLSDDMWTAVRGSDHPSHNLAYELGDHIVLTTFGKLPSAEQEFCTHGKLFRSLTLQQPRLRSSVRKYLERSTASPDVFVLQGYLNACDEFAW